MAGERTTLYIEANAICAVHQSGVGHAAQGLVDALLHSEEARARYRIALITPVRGGPQLKRLHLDDARRVHMPLPLRGYDRWAALPWLPPLDLLLGRGVYLFPNFGNWPVTHSRSATFIHDLAFMRLPASVEANTRARLQANASRWTRRTDLVVAPSEFSKAEVMDCLGVAPSRIAVVPWGVDRRLFSAQSADQVGSTLARLQLPRDYVLYLGNFEPRKNLVRLVRGYSRLDPRLKAAHPLLLVGSNSWNAEPIEAEIAAAREQGDRVVRVSTRVSDADLPALLSGAVMLAHPALYEGFGLVPLQAMACGTPVLVGDRSAMCEVVGSAGLHVNPFDEYDITEKMTTMLTDSHLRIALAAAGVDRAAAFSWDRTVSSLLTALRSIE